MSRRGAGNAAVLLVGGPLAGHGFTAREWDMRRESALAMQASRPSASPALEYAEWRPRPQETPPVPSALDSYVVTFWRHRGLAS